MQVWELYSNPKVRPGHWRHLHFSLRIVAPRAEGMAQQIRAVAILAKDPDLIPSILIAALAPPTVIVSEYLMPSSDLPGMHVVHMQAEHAFT